MTIYACLVEFTDEFFQVTKILKYWTKTRSKVLLCIIKLANKLQEKKIFWKIKINLNVCQKFFKELVKEFIKKFVKEFVKEFVKKNRQKNRQKPQGTKNNSDTKKI